jgi:ketosteroid isomerase-like protein
VFALTSRSTSDIAIYVKNLIVCDFGDPPLLKSYSAVKRETAMPLRSFTIMAFLLLVTSLAHVQSTEDHTSDRTYIRQAESDWAESVTTNDIRVLERILADDFVGVDIDGTHYSKADAINDSRTHPGEFVSNHLNEVQIRFYGETAVAQGNESWRKKDGSAGKFVWTDTWIRRGGKWQIVAAEDLVQPAGSTARP